MPLGYSQGQDFGDPAGFKRGTGEGELDHFNTWMRSQPWHVEYLTKIGQFGKPLNLSEKQQKELARVARANGVNLPEKDLSMDQAGNLNQNSRLGRNIAIAGIVGAGVLTGGAALGAFGPGAAGAAGGAAAAGSGVLPSTAIGSGFVPAIAGGTGLAGGTGAGIAAGAGAAAKGGGLFSALKSRLGGPAIEAAATGLGRYSAGAAANRGTQAERLLDTQKTLEEQLIAREQEKRAAQSDAYSKAMRADLAKNWKPATRPGNIPTISFTSGPSAEARGVSDELFKQAAARMKAPDLQNQTGMPTYKDPTQDPELRRTQRPGIGERLSGYGAAALPLVGALLGRR